MPTVGTVQYLLTRCVPTSCCQRRIAAPPRGRPRVLAPPLSTSLPMHSMWAALGRGSTARSYFTPRSLPREAHCACGVPSFGRLQAAVRGAGLPRRAVGDHGRVAIPDAPPDLSQTGQNSPRLRACSLGCHSVGTLRRGRHRDSPPATPPQLPGTHVPKLEHRH